MGLFTNAAVTRSLLSAVIEVRSLPDRGASASHPLVSNLLTSKNVEDLEGSGFRFFVPIISYLLVTAVPIIILHNINLFIHF